LVGGHDNGHTLGPVLDNHLLHSSNQFHHFIRGRGGEEEEEKEEEKVETKNGIFSVSSMYRFLINNGVKVSQIVWRLKISLKIKIFIFFL